jgi:hypothetical protein
MTTSIIYYYNTKPNMSDTDNFDDTSTTPFSENTGARQKRCSKCREFVKGHNGPIGDKCRNSEDTEQKQEDGTPPSSVSDFASLMGQQSIVLNQILEQLTLLNINTNTDIKPTREPLPTWSLPQVAPSRTTDTTSMSSLHDGTQSLGAMARPASTAPHHATNTSNAGAQLFTGTTSLPLGVPGTPNDVYTTSKLLTTALSGEYVNLCQFIDHDNDIQMPEYEPALSNELDGNMSFKLKKSNKCIDNFTTWMTAWNKYESLIMQHRPQLYHHCMEYRQFIQNCNAKFIWPAVCSYDMQHRKKLSKTRTFAFNVVDTSLYITTFDITTVKANPKQCFRCKALDHMVSLCPFPALAAEKKKKIPQTPRNAPSSTLSFDRWFYNGQEGCNLKL